MANEESSCTNCLFWWQDLKACSIGIGPRFIGEEYIKNCCDWETDNPFDREKYEFT
jgi:hypothetical protein